MDSKKTLELRQKFYSSWKSEKSTEQASKSPIEDLPKFPINIELPKKAIENVDFGFDLDIISNFNEKEKIKISYQPGKLAPIDSKNIPNLIDFNLRDEFYRQFNFITDYRSGYTPIEVQDQQEKEFSYKNHFIRT